MKSRLETLAALALVSTLFLPSTGCSSKRTAQGGSMGAAEAPTASTSFATRAGEPGGLAIGTYQEVATVTRIDRKARMITLLSPTGAESTVKAGPEVANFDQIEPGDKVRATVTEELVVFVRDSNEPPRRDQSTSVAVAPVGGQPGVVMADTVEMTAKVVAINQARHEATVQFPDGRFHTFRVRPDVDLTKRRVGEEVVFRSTETTAIRLEKQ